MDRCGVGTEVRAREKSVLRTARGSREKREPLLAEIQNRDDANPSDVDFAFNFRMTF